MAKKVELREGEEAAECFMRLAKKIVRVPKSEIDRRAKDWREARKANDEEEDKE